MENNVEVSSEEDSKTVSGIPQEDIDEINKEDFEDNLNMDNIESLKIDRKPNIYQNEKPYDFKEEKERIDVVIKNYLMKFNMEKSYGRGISKYYHEF